MASLSESEFGVLLALLPFAALVLAYFRTAQAYIRLSTHRSSRIWKLAQLGKLEALNDYALQVTLDPAYGWLEPTAIRWGLKDPDPAAFFRQLKLAKHLVRADSATGKMISTRKRVRLSHEFMSNAFIAAAAIAVPFLGVVLQVFLNMEDWLAFGLSCIVGVIYIVALGMLGASYGAADLLLKRPPFSAPPSAAREDTHLAGAPTASKRVRRTLGPTTKGAGP